MKVYYPIDQPSIYPRTPGEDAWETLLARLDSSITILTGSELPDPADYEVLISGTPTEEQIEASPNLRIVLVPWAGLPAGMRDLMKNYPGIAVHNLHHNAVPTAETALTLLFAAAKRMVPIERKFRQNDWRPRYGPNPAMLLHGKTILILGYGSIGQHIGQVCRAMGMRVLAVRRSGSPIPDDPAQAEVYPSDALAGLLPQANVLMVTVPLTEETEGLIGEAELAALPDNAILVNIGRGPVVEQGALYRALESGKLHSAGIDVWYNYPVDEEARANTPPADYPFRELDSIVMSPHRGGGAMDVEYLRLEKMADLLNAAALGRQVPNRVDLERGY